MVNIEMNKSRIGISPVIATVIIVAVAIAISIAVAGWIMGLWGGFGQTESLKIYPDSYAVTIDNGTTKTGYLVLHLQNVGGSPAQIYKIQVANNTIDETVASAVKLENSDPGEDGVASLSYGSLPVTVNPGEEKYLVVKIPDAVFSSGTIYNVTLYTASGNVYTTSIYGKGVKTVTTGGGGGSGGSP